MALAHGRTHVAMLNYGLRRHDRREIVSQLLRLAVAAPRHMDRALPRLATRRCRRHPACRQASALCVTRLGLVLSRQVGVQTGTIPAYERR
jgi:hypothetical protein